MKKICAILFLIVCSLSANCQWKKLKYIDKPLVCISSTPTGNTIFIGTGAAEIGRSTDDGTNFTFQKLESQGYIEDFLFENEKVGYACGGCIIDAPDCSANTIFKTTDGGITWNILHKTDGIGKITHLQKTSNGKLFGLGEFDGVFVSKNEKKFQKMEIDPQLTKGSFVNFQMFDDGIGYISHIFKTRKKIYKTLDFGDTWFNIFESELLDFTAEFHFADSNQGFLKLNKGSFFQTEDGGITWKQVRVASEFHTINQTEFVSTLQGYFVSRHGGSLRGNLFRTNNGGLTWTQELGMETTYWTDLYPIDEERALAIVDDNKILKRVTPTKLEENTIKIFPNPFKESLKIRLEYYDPNLVFEIYDSFSRLVAKERLIDFENVLDGSFFNNGYHYIRILKNDVETIHSQGFIKI